MQDAMNIHPWKESEIGAICVLQQIKKQRQSPGVNDAMWVCVLL
jgi:hypothetical protein